MNRLAIASFVFGLLGGMLAPVFGIVALLQIRRTGERGKPFAVAGLVLFGFWTLVLILVLTVAAPRFDPEAGVPGLRVGDCFTTPGTRSDTTTAPKEIAKVPCDQPHGAELIGQLSPYDGWTDERYPGASVLAQRAEIGCRKQLRDYVLDPLSLPADVRLSWYIPARSEWRVSPQVTCYLAAGSTPVTRSLRQDATVIKPEQVSFLVADRDFNEAVAMLKADGPSASLTELRDMVEHTGDEHTELSVALWSQRWPHSALPAIERLLTAVRQAGEPWDKAEKATVRTEILTLVAQAGQHRDRQAELAVRRALGLSTVRDEPAR